MVNITERFSIDCRKQFRVCFGFALLRSGKKTRHYNFSTNESQTKTNQEEEEEEEEEEEDY